MKLVKATLAIGAALGATFAAVPAVAQVNGIATSNPDAVILNSQARIDAYRQISETYASQIQQVATARQEVATLQQSLDTNSDGELTVAEQQANPTVMAQIEQKQQQIATLYRPIALAQTYAIEQLLLDYANARNQVVQQKNIQMLLSPDVIQFAPETADVTGDIVDALDQRMPSVQAVPPQDWQPSQQSFAMQQRMQQILLGLAQEQAYRAALAQRDEHVPHVALVLPLVGRQHERLAARPRVARGRPGDRGGGRRRLA